jgi:hypothetical protein
VPLEVPPVRDHGGHEAALLDRARGDDVRYRKGSPPKAHDRLVRSHLVEEALVVVEGELPAQADELADARALPFAVGGPVALLLAEDARVSPLTAHLAAQVAEVGDAELEEGRHGDGRPVLEMREDGAPPSTHTQVIGEREAGASQPTSQPTHARLCRHAVINEAEPGRVVFGKAPRAGTLRDLPGLPVARPRRHEHVILGSADASRRCPYA